MIDDPEKGGSDPGAWERHLRHTQFTNPARPVTREMVELGGEHFPAQAVGDGPAPLLRVDVAKLGQHRNSFNPERIYQ